jgi:hypothetical protein
LRASSNPISARSVADGERSIQARGSLTGTADGSYCRQDWPKIYSVVVEFTEDLTFAHDHTVTSVLHRQVCAGLIMSIRSIKAITMVSRSGHFTDAQ